MNETLSLKQMKNNWVVLLLYTQALSRNKLNISNYLKLGKKEHKHH